MLKPQRKVCAPCRKKFPARKPNQQYCSATCRKRGNRHLKQSFEAHKTAFVMWLISKCRYAGTVQILTDTDYTELYELFMYRNKANGFGVKDTDQNPRFELSHIAPTIHDEIMGTLHPLNLVVAPAPYNRARGNNWNGTSGKWIKKSELLPKWEVEKGERAKSVAEKIEKFYPEGFKKLLSDFKLKLGKQHQMAKQLAKQGVDTPRALERLSYDQLEELCEKNPVIPKRQTMLDRILLSKRGYFEYRDELDSLSTDALKELYLTFPSVAAFSLPRESRHAVYKRESERLGIVTMEYLGFLRDEHEHWNFLHGEEFTIAVTPESDSNSY